MWTKLKVLAFGLAAFGLALGGLAIASQLSLAQAAPMEPDLGKKDVIPAPRSSSAVPRQKTSSLPNSLSAISVRSAT